MWSCTYVGEGRSAIYVHGGMLPRVCIHVVLGLSLAYVFAYLCIPKYGFSLSIHHKGHLPIFLHCRNAPISRDTHPVGFPWGADVNSGVNSHCWPAPVHSEARTSCSDTVLHSLAFELSSSLLAFWSTFFWSPELQEGSAVWEEWETSKTSETGGNVKWWENRSRWESQSKVQRVVQYRRAVVIRGCFTKS